MKTYQEKRKQGLAGMRGFLSRHREALLRIASVVLALLLWQMIAMLLNERLILVSPVDVLRRLSTVWQEDGFLAAICFSLSRTAVGFVSALIVGAILALLSGRYRAVEILLYPYMLTVKTVPVASFIVLAYVWFSSSALPGLISFLIVLPTVYNNLLAGLRSVDGKMIEMANVFRLSFSRRLLCIYLPHMRPYVLSAASLAAGLAWKSAIAAEIIAAPGGSIGNMIYYANLWLQTEDLFVWTLIIVLLSVAFEKLFSALLRLGFRLLGRL